MGDDLKGAIEALTKNVVVLQKHVEANAKAIADLALAQSSSARMGRGLGGEHHQDRPPKHWRPEFPKYDSKSDLLAFLNQ